MGWFDEQIRQRIQRDDDMFADAFAQMANLVSGEKIMSSLSDDRRLTVEAIGDILRYYHVKAQEVPEQLTDLGDVLEYLLRPSGVMRRTVKLSKGWHRDAIGAMLGSKKDGSIIAILPGKTGGYTYKDYATGKITRPGLGITGQEVSGYYGYVPGGIMVASVTEGSPADQAGMKVQDIITAIDGKEISTLSELRAALYAHKIGDTITVTVFRESKSIDLTVTLAELVQD